MLYKDSKVKVTPLAYLIEAIVSALKEFPIFNSSLVGDGELMLRNYINIGIAVDTEQGLVVPVIKNTDNFSVKEIAEKITELAAKAKQKKLMKDDLEGATFTVSSLGPLGGTGFSPIINPPEVGIIGVSRSKQSFIVEGKEIIQKIMLPISLSYDHRVINGVDAGKFMVYVKKFIEKSV